jgi:DNA-binding NarL/FixJ family response regulator
VHAIRILLVAMPHLMCDILEQGLRTQPELEVVGVLDSLSSLATEARRAQPDVLVLGVDGQQLPPECGPVFAQRPDLRVFAIELDAAEAALYELRPRRVPLGSVSPAALAVAIRDAARTPARLWDAS